MSVINLQPSTPADNSITSAKINDGAIATADIADSAVTTAKINDAAVTTAKINDSAVTTAKVNDAAVTEAKIGSAAVTEAKIGSGAVTEAKIGSSAVTEAKIGTGAVTATKLDTGAVTTAKINDAAVTTAKLGASSVATANIGDSQVTTAKINDAAVTEAKIGTAAVTADKIGSSAVTTAKINDAAVTSAKLEAALSTKLGYISITQAVNLDTVESDLATNVTNVANHALFLGYRSYSTLTFDSDVVDNTTALNTLLSTYTGSTLVLPPGVLRVTGTINIPASTRLAGTSGYRTTIKFDPSGIVEDKCIEFTGDGGSLEDLVIKQYGYQTSTATAGRMVYAMSQDNVTLRRVKIWGPTIQEGGTHGTHTGHDSTPVSCLQTIDCSRWIIEDSEVRGSNNTYGWDCQNLSMSVIHRFRSYDNGWDGMKLYYGTNKCRFIDIEADNNGQHETNGGGIDGSPNRCMFSHIYCHDNDGVGLQLKTGSSADTNANCYNNVFNGVVCEDNVSNGIGMVHSANASGGYFGGHSFDSIECIGNGLLAEPSPGSAITISPGSGMYIHGCKFNNVLLRGNAGGFNFSNGRSRDFMISNLEAYGNGTGSTYNFVLRGKGHRLSNILLMGVNPMSIGTYGANTDASLSGATPVAYGMYSESPADDGGAGNYVSMEDVCITNLKSRYHVGGGDYAYNLNSSTVTLIAFNAATERIRFVNEYPRQHGIYRGTGDPETVVTAGIGSIYQRTDGSTTTSLYVKTSGTGSTGWTAK